MLVFWEWVILASLFAGFGWLAIRYFRSQAVSYNAGKRNADSDVFQGKGGGCH